ncbi:hypothetical protein DSL72_009517 [Monilinia vaccinii-corymbosi]|uniref:Cyanovirin-N domain-containing protein n=1 Tax=Monilinia vaccinii-corymbosi TaxID=61207 RepID=A0A8A3PRB6_9HELO|nr:hypothetical protein DSL72_009517 [Monilinia vaccinii-corymbosi]
MVQLSSALLASILVAVTSARPNGFINHGCNRNSLRYENNPDSSNYGYLSAACDRPRSINLNVCIANNNGMLVWDTVKHSFTKSCSNCSVNNTAILACKCNSGNGVRDAAINLNDGIAFQFGQMTCN